MIKKNFNNILNKQSQLTIYILSNLRAYFAFLLAPQAFHFIWAQAAAQWSEIEYFIQDSSIISSIKPKGDVQLFVDLRDLHNL